VIHWQPGYIYPPVFYPPHYPLGLRSAFVYVLVALAVGALALRRPANGLAALIALTPFAYAHYIGGTSLTLGKAAFVGFILGLVAHRPSPGVLRDPRVLRIVIALCAVIGAMVLSGLAAEHRDAVVREVGKWVEYGLLFVAGVIAFSNDPDDRPIWATIAGVTALVAVLALAQEFIGAPAGVFLHGVAYPRIAGPLEGPNQLAGWLGIAIPLLLARVLGHRDGRLVAVLAFAAVVDVLSLSRSGIVAAVVGCAVVVAVSKPPRAVGLRFAGGALTVGAIIVVLGTAVGIESRFFSLAEVRNLITLAPERSCGKRPSIYGERVPSWELVLETTSWSWGRSACPMSARTPTVSIFRVSRKPGSSGSWRCWASCIYRLKRSHARSCAARS
jgi:hypothetical protein